MNNFERYIKEHNESEMHPAELAKILKNLNDHDFSEAIKRVPNDLVGDVALALPDRYFDDVVEKVS